MEDLKIAGDALRRTLDKDNRLMTGFHNTYKNAMKNEKNLQGLRVKMANELQALSAWENNERMVGVYKDISQGFLTISASHQTYINQVENKVIPVLADYSKKTRDVKQSAINYETKQKDLTKKQLAATKAGDNPAKRDAAQKDMDKAKVDFHQEIGNLTRRLKAYEYERTSDFKQILLHNINAEMHYHAKALERLSQMAYEVYKVDDKQAAEHLLMQMLNNMVPMNGQPQTSSAQPQPQSQMLSSQHQTSQLVASQFPSSQIPGVQQSTPQLQPQIQSQLQQSQAIGQSQLPK